MTRVEVTIEHHMKTVLDWELYGVIKEKEDKLIVCVKATWAEIVALYRLTMWWTRLRHVHRVFSDTDTFKSEDAARPRLGAVQ